MKQTLDVKTIALNRAIQLLTSLGAQFKVIMPDGGEFGALEAVQPKKGTKYGYGVLREHVRPIMLDMKVGDVVELPIAHMDAISVQAAAGSYAADAWGPGSIMSTQRKDRAAVEVMRVG